MGCRVMAAVAAVVVGLIGVAAVMAYEGGLTPVRLRISARIPC
jgi:hypothetical protein